MGFSLGKFFGTALTNPTDAISNAVAEDTAKSNYKWEQKQNIRLWNMQNEYNSPEAQMQRYVDAGLNPNLIYSQQNTASDISSPSSLNPQYGQGTNSLLNTQQLISMGLKNEAQEIDNMYNQMYGGKQRQHLNFLTYQQGLMQHEQYERLKMENDFFKKIGANAKGMDMLFRALSLMRGMN